MERSPKRIRLCPPTGTPEPSDRELLGACAHGDSQALGILYDRHGACVARFLGRLAHVDHSDAEDLVQESFIAAFRSAARFQGDAAVRTWLLAIAANLARMRARSALRGRHAVRREAECPRVNGRPEEERRLEARERLDRLEHALAALPHELRVAFVLCELETVPGVEAAQALQIPEGTLYRRIHEARQRLLRALGEEDVP